MPDRRWPTQNELNGILVDFLSHMALFGQILSYWPLTFWLHVFMFCVSWVFLCGFLFCKTLSWFFLLACLFPDKRKKGRGAGWGEWWWYGRTWERETFDQNIYHIKFIFNNIYHTHMHIHIKFAFPTKYFNKTKSNGKDYRRHYRSPGPFEPVSNTVAFVRWPTKLFNTWRTHQISWGGQTQWWPYHTLRPKFSINFGILLSENIYCCKCKLTVFHKNLNT